MRLPAELLLYIFRIYRDSWLLHADHTSPAPGKSPLRNHNAWVRITHVCAHWRRLALADHGLWTRVVLYKEDCTAAFLERSASRSLAVTCRVTRNTSSPVEAISLVLQHASRIRELSVDYDHSVAENPTWQAHSFPQLRSLDLGDGDIPPFIRLTDPLDSLEEIGMDFDHLPTLELVAECSANLVRIRLHGRCRTATWTQIFHTLAKVAPRVQKLSIFGGLPSAGAFVNFLRISDIPSYAPVVFLPQLRSLAFSGSAARCMVFLQHIVLPPSAALVIEIGDKYSSRHRRMVFTSLACSVIERALRQDALGPPSNFRTLQFGSYVHARRRGLTIRAWEDALPIDMVHGPPGFQYEHCHPPKLEVTFRNYPVTDRVIECFLGRISWTEVEQLFAVSSLSDESIFGGMDAVTEGVWRTELGRLTKLRGLSVDECGAPGLRAALLPSQDEPAQVLWPALEVLQLRNVSLADDSSVLPDNKDVHVLSQSEAVTKEEWVQDLGDVIRARRSLEAGPRVLSVRHCLSDATALERLSECGVELEVVPESPLYPGDSWYTPEDWEMNALDDCFT